MEGIVASRVFDPQPLWEAIMQISAGSITEDAKGKVAR